MTEIMQNGGPIIVVLVVLSLVGCLIAVERLLSLRRQVVLPAKTVQLLDSLLEQGKVDRAEFHCEQESNPLTRIVGAGIGSLGMPAAELRLAMEERGRRETHLLERRLGVLAAIATVAPLVGLLGTITGMIHTFRSVSGDSGFAIENMTGGIWQALLTTAAGLCVAIPVFLLHRVLLGIVDRRLDELEELAHRFSRHLVKQQRSTADPAMNTDAS